MKCQISKNNKPEVLQKGNAHYQQGNEDELVITLLINITKCPKNVK
jgi:hypothetical protein